MKAPKQKRELFECPNCGADVPVGRKACPECGSDDATGWQPSQEIDYQGVELPEGYAVDPEHPGHVVEKRGRAPVLLVIVVVALVALLVWTLSR